MERETYYGPNPEKPLDEGPEIKEKEKKKEKKLSFLDELLDKRKQNEAKERANKDGEDSAESKIKEPTKKELAKEFLEHKAEELKDEITVTPSSERKAEIQADLELVAAISEKIDDPYREVEPAVEEAYQELMAALDEKSPDDIEDIQQHRAVPIIPLSEIVSEDGPSTDDKDAASTVSAPSVTSSTTTPTPTAPTTRPIVSVPFAPTPQTRPQPFPSSSVNHGAPLPTESSPKTPEVADRRRVAGKMLVAGALGYVIGRHGGRKRTEAKLQPEIEKRNVAIKDLEKNIESKEYQIRSITKEQTKNNHQAAHHQAESPAPTPIIEKLSVGEKAPEHITPPPILFERPTEPPTPEDLSKPMEDEFIPPELVLTNSEIHTPSIGLHESINATDKEKTPYFKLESKEKEAPIPKVEQLSTPDLLSLAERVTVLDTNVRKLYETNQIDRQGLEEIVKTHLSGRDIAPVLDRRLLGAEISQERAREFKHDPGGSDDSLDVALSNINKKEADKKETPASSLPPVLPEAERPTTSSEDDNEHPLPIASPTPPSDSHEKAHKTMAVSATVVIVLIVALFITLLLLNS